MTAILCKRTVSGLVADDDAATSVLRKIKVGDVVKVEVRRPRNLAAHRRWFALVNLIYSNSEDYGSPEEVHGALKVLAGHSIPVMDKSTGEILARIPKSISFSALDEDAFQEVWKCAVKAVSEHILPGVTEPEIEAEILNLIGAGVFR